MKIVIRNFVWISLVFFASACQILDLGNFSVTGVVKDVDTGDPLSGVEVELVSSGEKVSVTTNASGSFRFEHLEMGEYKLNCSKIDYTSQSKKLKVRHEYEQSLEIKLQGYVHDMVYVAGGTFQMGATEEQGTVDVEQDEYPVHSVTLSDFYMAKYPVTKAQWIAVMGSSPSPASDPSDFPVRSVTWLEAQIFIEKLNLITGRNYRLPTEAEWEYAARGGMLSQGYKYAGSNTLNDVAWYNGNSNAGQDCHPVGQKLPNELGLYDMSGLVVELCQDYYSESYYAESPQVNPKGPASGQLRTMRGGSYYSVPRECRVADRWDIVEDARYVNVGFRLVMDKEYSAN